MDRRSFDGLVARGRRWATRRRLVGGAVVGALAAFGVDRRATAAPHGVGAEACVEDGQRCGRGPRRRPCSACCSRYDVRSAGGRRCSCRPDGLLCGNDSQCCTGRCRNGTCGTSDEVTFEPRLTAAVERVRPDRYRATGSLVRGDIVEDGTYVAVLDVVGVTPGPTTEYAILAEATIREEATDSTLVLFIVMTAEISATGQVAVAGTFEVGGGTGRFRGASGDGRIKGKGEANGPDGAGNGVLLDGRLTFP